MNDGFPPPPLAFKLELEPSSDAIHGMLEGPDGRREPFWGWIELMAALERAAPRPGRYATTSAAGSGAAAAASASARL